VYKLGCVLHELLRMLVYVCMCMCLWQLLALSINNVVLLTCYVLCSYFKVVLCK